MLNRQRIKCCYKINHLVNILSFCLLLKLFHHVNCVSKSDYNSIHESSEKDELGNETYVESIENSLNHIFNKESAKTE